MSKQTQNMNIEEFRKLEQVVKGEGKKRIVDWDAVLKTIAGKPFNSAMFETSVKTLFPLKVKGVNYSEMYRVMSSWTKAGHTVICKKDPDGKIWYMIELKK